MMHEPSGNAVVVVKCVRNASYLLREAVYRLDDAALECTALNDLAAYAAALSASWAGRPVPPFPDALPGHAVEAAREWRRQNRRSY